MSYNKNAHKTLSFASFIILLILGFVTISKFYNISEQTAADTSVGIIFLLVGAMIVIGLLQTIQIMNLTKDTIQKEDYTKKTYLSDIDKIEDSASQKQTSNSEEEAQMNFDIEEIGEKILRKTEKITPLSKYCEHILSNIAKEYDIVQGLFYYRKKDSDLFTIASKYAYFGEEEPQDFELGKTLSGQTAKNQKVLNLTQIPENYITILSGLGSSSPDCLLFVPIIHEEKTVGIMELASFKTFSKETEQIFTQLSERIGKKISEKIT